MRRVSSCRSAVTGLALILSAVVLGLPAAASARNGFDLYLQIPADHGYTVSFGGYDATAMIAASRSLRQPRRYAVSSTYVARGRVSPTSIEADFGAFGHASMRFRPSGQVTRTKPRRHCLGPDHYTIRSGVFVGSVRFRGEDGYTSATAHRIKGKAVTPAQLVCFGSLESLLREYGLGGGVPEKKKPKVTRLFAHWREAVAATYFEASRKRDVARFQAATERTGGKLAIYRSAYVKAPAPAFGASLALSKASTQPPAPFSGSGTFQHGPQGAKLWTGSLAVSFPGEPDVPLTGPQFDAQLTRSW
jgi:hypothetical protein